MIVRKVLTGKYLVYVYRSIRNFRSLFACTHDHISRTTLVSLIIVRTVFIIAVIFLDMQITENQSTISVM